MRPMRILVQQKETDLYFKDIDSWTPDSSEAMDFVGSTAGMSDYVGTRQPKRVVLITECSMADNVAVENPGVEFLRPCNLCPHMKRITLPKILHALQTRTTEVIVDPEIAFRARRSVENMLAVGRK